ncbi:cytochrome P450 52A11 [Aaosphaeria arxii CBS 175.79]|uniref:Cytochrome P450 52A11 n=1 Tax=Aaosphaeria arxii CBS 175.79 TaxID=1450172 RepID=A0A6A5XG96_9PLEO|nr:cytochrome P450 52A11 [Aaosphaeria arxii CBS 175.79]KAF2012255.1 cytochrome P450 52A11 [Aaosphaeria arxii CBS 175.79]
MPSLLTPYLTPLTLLPTLLALLILYKLLSTLRTSRQIARLGARAPIRTTYVPYGLDMLYEVVTHLLADKNYELWVGMFAKYGRGGFTVEAGIGQRVILTAEPENVKAILATQFKDYGKGEQFRKDFYDFLGNGIFTTDGHLWHNSRQLIRPQFVKDRLSDLDIFEEHVQILMREFSNGREIDAMDLFFRYTLDAATDFLLGKSVESLQNPQTRFADAFMNAQRVQSIISRLGPLNWAVPRKRMGFDSSIKIINQFIDQYIDTALALPPSELEKKTTHDQDYTFLHAIAGYTRDRTMLHDQIVSVLLAGRDTTACTLTWTIYELSRQPHITAKLRQEIINTVGLDAAPTYQHLKDMKYLQHILNETLRLYPVVPFNVRVSLTDTTLPTGGGPDGTLPIGIPKDTPIAYSTLVMQRRADLYPPPSSGFPAVDLYCPERWDGWTPKSWTYIPFNGGPRICIGQQFALTEMAYTLVRLFQRFETVENRMGGEEPGMHMDIVLQPAREIKVAFV